MTKRLFVIFLSFILIPCGFAQIPDIVAHRGASYDAPENTIAAFKLAWEQGADIAEGDFRLTADGEIVCIHDQDTARVSDDYLVVSKSTLAQLRRIEVGAWKGKKWAGEKL